MKKINYIIKFVELCIQKYFFENMIGIYGSKLISLVLDNILY